MNNVNQSNTLSAATVRSCVVGTRLKLRMLGLRVAKLSVLKLGIQGARGLKTSASKTTLSKKILLALGVSPMMAMGVHAATAQGQDKQVGADVSIELRAAGSLQVAMNDIISAYQVAQNQTVAAQYAPSGLLLKRIQAGEKVDLFASANMKHPQALVDAGQGEQVHPFARNQLCALAQPGIELTSDNMLEKLLDPNLKLGTSTPKADPAGDYAWALFARAEKVQAQSQSRLEAKALQLTGGPDSAKAPADRNPYGWVMENKQADIFLTYCTNAVLAKKQVTDLQIVNLPSTLAVGADYGLVVLKNAQAATQTLAEFILSPKGQAILTGYGFQPPQ